MFLYHIFKNQLMHFIFQITLLKHNHSSKTLECLCPCATLHVLVINLDHPQGLDKNNTGIKVKEQIIRLLKVIIEQNYFQYNEHFFKPKNGIAM
jgi:hypothetical protein